MSELSPDEVRDVLRWHELVEVATAKRGLDTMFVLAIIAQESRGRPGAFNPEPKYRWFWNVETGAPFREVTAAEIDSKVPPSDFPRPAAGADYDAEWWGQQASWGLMQTMGAVAREAGFAGVDFPDLSVPWRGIYYGVRHLQRLRKKFGMGDDLLATYNGGPGAKGKNRGYVALVHERCAELEAAMIRKPTAEETDGRDNAGD